MKLKQLNIEKAMKINDMIDKKEKEENKEKPIYQKLYPPLKDVFIYDENNEINNNLLKVKSKISKIKKKKNFLQESESDELNEDFLKDLIKNPCPIAKEKVIDVVSKFIQKSKLMEKLESDYQSEKKIGNESLSEICAERLTFIGLNPGDIVFKIGDIGDRFYFILSGSVSILKPKELPEIYMTFIQYLRYCMFLIKQNEDYLLSEVIKANDSLLSVTSTEDVKTIYKIVFMRNLTEFIGTKITNNKHLKLYFEKNEQKFEDYDIKIEELELLEQKKNKGIQGSAKEWENYITKRCRLTVSEQVFFRPYESILTDNKPKRIHCLCYDSFLYLAPGLFFGDTSLDFEINKRNATIRAEEETVLAYLERNDYLSIISPKYKMEKIKEMEFIYEKFFFSGINLHIFEKNFFHLFSPREYFRGNILFSNGTIPKSLILLKSGKISLDLKCSVIDIHNLIKFIYNNIFSNPIFSKLSQVFKNRYLPPEKISIIKNYINDPVLLRLKMHNSKFIEEMNTVKNYQIKILTNKETIGLEEIFLRLPYLMKAQVINEKIYCFELGLENLEKMLINGKDVLHSYIKFSINKVISLIERLQNIKENCINMSIIKYEKELLKNKGLKNFGINFKIKNDENKKKEENKNEKSRNKRFMKINIDKKNKEITDIDKELNNNSDNIKNYSTIIQGDDSSPIKLFMTNITPTSKSMFEQMNLAYEKIKRKQTKYKNNKINSNSNNSLNLRPSFSNTIKKSVINNNKNYTPFFKTVEIYKKFSYDSKIKDEKQLNNKNSFIIYDNNNKNNIQNIKNSNNNFFKQNEEKNQTSESESKNNNITKEQSNSIIKNQPLVKKINTFTLNYIPLNLMFQNENNTNKNNSFISNFNDLFAKNKKIPDLYSLKKNSSMIENNINNIGVINNQKNNDRGMELKKRLKIINKKYNVQSNNRNNEKGMKIIDKQKLISSIIKDFYKDIRLNGYTSFIHNKEINTVFNRKYKKKYDSAEKASNNIKLHLLKGSDSLPLIF